MAEIRRALIHLPVYVEEVMEYNVFPAVGPQWDCLLGDIDGLEAGKTDRSGALTGLSALDEQLSGKEPLMADLDLALEERRAALRETIPGVLLAAYDALGRTGRRPIVVAARGGHCSGCYLRLPPQLDSTIRRRLSLCSCPHCGRLLYPHTRMSDGDGASERKQETGTALARNDSPSKRTRGSFRKSRPRREARASRRGSNPS